MNDSFADFFLIIIYHFFFFLIGAFCLLLSASIPTFPPAFSRK